MSRKLVGPNGKTLATVKVGHMLAPKSPNCPKCNSTPDKHEVRNYSMMWHDGEVYCTVCNTFVRHYDAG